MRVIEARAAFCDPVDLLQGAHLGLAAAFAAIARTAAEAPVIVVTQGIPWRTAAVRIS